MSGLRTYIAKTQELDHIVVVKADTILYGICRLFKSSCLISLFSETEIQTDTVLCAQYPNAALGIAQEIDSFQDARIQNSKEYWMCL